MPSAVSLFRILSWPFTSEFCLFLTLSLFSLIFSILESLILTDIHEEDVRNLPTEFVTTLNDTNSNENLKSSILEIKSVFISSVFFLVGIVYISSKILFLIFFGRLSNNECGNVSRMLFKFTVLHSIILSGAINVTHLTSVFRWLVWFSILGILHSCALIATVRCSRFSASSRVSSREWLRMSLVLTFLLICNWRLCISGLTNRNLLADLDQSESHSPVSSPKRSFSVQLKAPTALGVLISKINGKSEPVYDTVDVVTYIVAETILLLCLTTQLLGNLLIQAYSRWAFASGRSWSHEFSFSYYLELFHVTVYHLIEILHYLHLLLWSRIFSVASLVVFLHIRHAYLLLSSRIRRHVAHRRLSKYVRDNYMSCFAGKSTGTVDEFTKDESVSGKGTTRSSPEDTANQESLDVCAICWEQMLVWKRLPCRHDFHETCIRSWLEQNTTCPTCRLDLQIPPSVVPTNTRNTQPDQVALGLILSNLVRHTGAAVAPSSNTTTPSAGSDGQTLTPSRLFTPQSNRNLFATAVGLNLGVSIGSGSIVTAAAQAAARDAGPSSASVNSIESSSSQVADNVQDSSTPTTDSRLPVASENDQPPDTLAQDESSQVRRRSFHFDGSRYFSWLPSLHVELSEVIREVFSGTAIDHLVPAAVRPVEDQSLTEDSSNSSDTGNTYDPGAYELIRLPVNLRAAAREIAAMFPQFPLSTVVADLLNTGVPEATVENLIQLPTPTTSHLSIPQASNTSSSLDASFSSPYVSFIEPTSTTESIASNSAPRFSQSANLNLNERRELMLNKARERFLTATYQHSLE